jgi:GT2 family glycosyltransferase
VGIVVVNWYGRRRTLECIDALRRLSYPNWSLILVENESSEFGADEVDRLVPGGRYIHSPRNLGFAGGANLGAREALRSGARFVWFLNNDAAPEPEALSELVAVAGGDPGCAVVGAKILRGADPRRLDSVALSLDLRSGRMRLLGHDERDHGQYDGLVDPLAVTGCAMLVSGAAHERLGGFDETFFAYLEDADLCLRAREIGYRVGFAPRARVPHQRPAAIHGRQSAASIYYTSRNHLVLVDRHGTGGRLLRPFRRFFVVLLSLAYCARLRDGLVGERLRALGEGVRDYRRGVGGGPWRPR